MTAKITTCPAHKGTCAYTGAEPDRCPGCHNTWAKIATCKCRDCGPGHASKCTGVLRIAAEQGSAPPLGAASPATGERHAACTRCGHTFPKPRKSGLCQSAAACARRAAGRKAA